MNHLLTCIIVKEEWCLTLSGSMLPGFSHLILESISPHGGLAVSKTRGPKDALVCRNWLVSMNEKNKQMF